MGSMKSVGGLTKGHGFEDTTSLTWLLSMPICGEVHKAMPEVTGISRAAESLKHKDLTDTRSKRDEKDLQTILDYFQERQPFSKFKVVGTSAVYHLVSLQKNQLTLFLLRVLVTLS